MKLFIILTLVAAIVADDYHYSSPSYSSYSSPSYSSYSSPSYSSYSAPSYSYAKQVLVYPPPYYKTVEYVGYTPAGKKGKKAVPVYKTVDKY
ncbi:uncharacterized protein LOC130704045 [Daphnia carinata]|uniref:uncharacterized protein LOC130704045 n=1 Tax=Daphnia carinata TaxID=120202 RepID=UPI00257ED066|nr:uncharacterized protein LOC130704045 [Daphnia carinata]